ncbi:MAG: hypothetical protein AVDCRST_MAG36-696, partial [uncultured Nocardioidaceae bacterium]
GRRAVPEPGPVGVVRRRGAGAARAVGHPRRHGRRHRSRSAPRVGARRGRPRREPVPAPAGHGRSRRPARAARARL